MSLSSANETRHLPAIGRVIFLVGTILHYVPDPGAFVASLLHKGFAFSRHVAVTATDETGFNGYVRSRHFLIPAVFLDMPLLTAFEADLAFFFVRTFFGFVPFAPAQVASRLFGAVVGRMSDRQTAVAHVMGIERDVVEVIANLNLAAAPLLAPVEVNHLVSVVENRLASERLDVLKRE